MNHLFACPFSRSLWQNVSFSLAVLHAPTRHLHSSKFWKKLGELVHLESHKYQVSCLTPSLQPTLPFDCFSKISETPEESRRMWPFDCSKVLYLDHIFSDQKAKHSGCSSCPVQTLPGCSFFAIVAKLSEFIYLLSRHIEKKLCTDAVLFPIHKMAVCALFIQKKPMWPPL